MTTGGAIFCDGQFLKTDNVQDCADALADEIDAELDVSVDVDADADLDVGDDDDDADGDGGMNGDGGMSDDDDDGVLDLNGDGDSGCSAGGALNTSSGMMSLLIGGGLLAVWFRPRRRTSLR